MNETLYFLDHINDEIISLQLVLRLSEYFQHKTYHYFNIRYTVPYNALVRWVNTFGKTLRKEEYDLNISIFNHFWLEKKDLIIPQVLKIKYPGY